MATLIADVFQIGNRAPIDPNAPLRISFPSEGIITREINITLSNGVTCLTEIELISNGEIFKIEETQAGFIASGNSGGGQFYEDELSTPIALYLKGHGDELPVDVAAFQRTNWGNKGITVFGTKSFLNFDDFVLNFMSIGQDPGSTFAAPLPKNSAESLGQMAFVGWDGSQLAQVAYMNVKARQNFEDGTDVDFDWELSAGSQMRIKVGVGAYKRIMVLDPADDYANDGAAAAGGIAVGDLYHTSGAVKIRLV